VLDGECDALRAVIHVTDSNLYILPAMRRSGEPGGVAPSERLATPSLSSTVLRFHFGGLGPPVMPFADARRRASCHAVIMVVRAGAAPYSTVGRPLKLSAGRFLGVVLNGANDAIRKTLRQAAAL